MKVTNINKSTSMLVNDMQVGTYFQEWDYGGQRGALCLVAEGQRLSNDIKTKVVVNLRNGIITPPHDETEGYPVNVVEIRIQEVAT